MGRADPVQRKCASQRTGADARRKRQQHPSADIIVSEKHRGPDDARNHIDPHADPDRFLDRKAADHTQCGPKQNTADPTEADEKADRNRRHSEIQAERQNCRKAVQAGNSKERRTARAEVPWAANKASSGEPKDGENSIETDSAFEQLIASRKNIRTLKLA